MEIAIAAILFMALLRVIYRLMNRESVDMHQERAEVQANLQTTLEELRELDELIALEDEERKGKKERPLRLLKKKVASKRHALKNTMGKVDVEGEQSWDYRKVQAERTMEAAKKLVKKETLVLENT